ncbi:unnamed protein product [Mytilus coruscus]|uniref:Integrase catalytic domain-containing protein n=1 Tax=Mytilus coruscus TaxID=42192 RepID=A0A6J8AND0_MYTCO|nr:unnamed protein product [Mytilus coruscus]
MKKGEKTEVIGAVSDESDSKVDEHAQTSTGLWTKVPGQGGLSLPIDDDSEELPVERRGRKQNRPPPAKQKRKPDVDFSLDAIKEYQQSDEILSKILKLKTEQTEKPAWKDISDKSLEFKFWSARWELLEIKNGVLVMKWKEAARPAQWKVCMPGSLVDPIIWYLHDARTCGHLGIKKIYERAKLSPFYWRNMEDTVKMYVNQCDICGERKDPRFRKRHQMKSYIVGAPFEQLVTDIAGPFPVMKNKNKYILVVADYFSKLTEIYPMLDMRATTVADIIVRAWVKRYGCPTELHSDQDRQYESLIFKELCQLLEIHKTRTTSLHPRSDGMVERMNRTVNDMLSKYIKTHQRLGYAFRLYYNGL